jgi:hypothetical protein
MRNFCRLVRFVADTRSKTQVHDLASLTLTRHLTIQPVVIFLTSKNNFSPSRFTSLANPYLTRPTIDNQFALESSTEAESKQRLPGLVVGSPRKHKWPRSKQRDPSRSDIWPAWPLPDLYVSRRAGSYPLRMTSEPKEILLPYVLLFKARGYELQGCASAWQPCAPLRAGIDDRWVYHMFSFIAC